MSEIFVSFVINGYIYIIAYASVACQCQKTKKALKSGLFKRLFKYYLAYLSDLFIDYFGLIV